MLSLVPRGTDAELRTTAGEYVEGGDDLCEQTRVPVRHARDKKPEPHGAGVRRHESERGVSLEHRILGCPRVLDLEIVIHE